MNLRAAEIYIGGRTQRRLRWIANATGETADGIADRVLNDWIEATYPQILPIEEKLEEPKRDYDKRRQAAEREFAASLEAK